MLSVLRNLAIMQRFTYMRHVMARKAKQPKRWFQRLQPLSHLSLIHIFKAYPSEAGKAEIKPDTDS